MRIAIFLTSLLPMAAGAQVLVPTVITPLNTTLNETSGLVVLNGQVWTQLDSGNPNSLYRLDPTDGEVLRSVVIANAPNTDWEDIAADGQWLYIGDFGNNNGDRTDLRVYRVALADLLDTANASVLADTIRFAYALQSDFTSATNNNDWDCEAMIAVDDSLFLFSKNWVNNKSYLYALPATPGDHFAERRDTLDAQGLVTGATYDPANGAIALIGYTDGLYLPFVWRFAGYPQHAFFQGVAQRNMLSSGITQMEGIAWHGIGSVYISNEMSVLNGARLWELQLDLPTVVAPTAAPSADVRPTVGNGRFAIRAERSGTLRIFDANGRVVLTTEVHQGDNAVDASFLPPGTYAVQTGAAGAGVPIVVQR